MDNGWANAKLGDVLDYIQPSDYIVNSTEYSDEYKTPVLTAGKSFVIGYTNETNNLFNRLPAIIFDDFTTSIQFVNFQFKVKSSAMKILVPASRSVDIRYVFYLMKTLRVNTDTHKRFWISIFSQLPIKIAAPPEQRVVADQIEEMFSDLDNAIENIRKAQEQLKVYRHAVLKNAFFGKFTEAWREKHPYKQKYFVTFNKKIEESNRFKIGRDLPRRLPPINLSNLYDLPGGWQWIEAHKVCQSVRDGTHDTPKYVEEGIPLVTSKNLKSGEIDFENVDCISREDHKKIEERSGVEIGDILFGMIGTIGNPVVVKEKRTFSIKNVGLFKQNVELICSAYLKYWLDSSVMMNILKEKDLIRGTTQKFIALGGLRVLPVPIPNLEEQDAIVQEIESRFSVCDKLEESIKDNLQKAEALRQSILKQAFEGKLTEQWRKEHKDLISGENSAEALLRKIQVEKKVLQVKPKGKKKHD